MPHEEPSDRPVLGYIRGERYSLAVDAGNSRRHVEKFYAALDAAELRRPDFTVLTHWHWDHTFGLHAVDGAAIACEATNEMLCRASRWKWSEEAMRERLWTGEEIEFCDKHIRAEYPDRTEISVVPAGLVFHGRLSIVPFPVSWTVKMKKKQKETQDILSYHTQAAGCSDKARAKASGGRQPIEECGRTGL